MNRLISNLFETFPKVIRTLILESLSIPILLSPENGYPSKISYQLFLIDSKVLMVDLSYRSSLFYRFTVATVSRRSEFPGPGPKLLAERNSHDLNDRVVGTQSSQRIF